MAGETTKALSPAELAEVRRFGIHPELSSREMTDIEDARAALANLEAHPWIDDRTCAWLKVERREAQALRDVLRALITEHDDAVKEAEMRRSESADFERERDAAVKEMHARELHHFETEKAITEALAEADRVSSSRPHWAVLNRVVNILRDTLNGTSAPPTDDEREIAEKRWPVMVTGYTDDDGSRFEYESPENRKLREAYLDGVAAGFRRQGPITDARDEAEALYQESEWTTFGVIAALRSAYEAGARREGRAALEAARDAS